MNINQPNSLFEDLIGQPTAIALLTAALESERISNAYLFCGPDGVGRRLAALRFLEGLINSGKPSLRERHRLKNKNHPDLHWVEPTYINQGELIPKSIAEVEGVNRRNPPIIRLNQIRSITHFLSQKPLESKKGMVVIECLERMAESAANALLKTLEEPGNGLLILITSRAEHLLPTIRSRCQIIPFQYLGSEHLHQVLLQSQEFDQANLQLGYKEEVLLKLANGSPGALLSHIETWLEIPKILWPKLQELPKYPFEALSLAKEITESLDGEQQLWLISWLEQYLWSQSSNKKPLERLEKLRRHLMAFVQPRIAWEVALLEIMTKNN